MPGASAVAQGGGAGAGQGASTASQGGAGASPIQAPSGKRFVYTGLEQVVEDPRCGKCGKDLSRRGAQQLACGACRRVPYCDERCLETHYLGHMGECFGVISDRVLAGDVHKDDYSGEYVLKDYVGECTAKYGALDARTLIWQRIYGGFLRQLGRQEEAKVLLLAARKGFQDSFGPRHHGTLVCTSDLAQLLHAQGKLDEAKLLMLEVLEAQRATLGPMHPDTLVSMNNLAALLLAQGRLGEAEALAREALAGRRSALGYAHPDTQSAFQGLPFLLTAQGKHREARELMASIKE